MYQLLAKHLYISECNFKIGYLIQNIYLSFVIGDIIVAATKIKLCANKNKVYTTMNKLMFYNTLF